MDFLKSLTNIGKDIGKFTKSAVSKTGDAIEITKLNAKIAGVKSEIDRFYRLYSEFGIPCFAIFDGDKQNIGHDDEKATIKKNHGILQLFGCEDDFPDGIVHENYLGFEYRLEEKLSIGDVGKAKALRLYIRTKEEIDKPEKVPTWVSQVIEKLECLPNEARSVLKKEETEYEFDL